MPTINANVSEAMREAIRRFAKAQTAIRGERVTISDVVVGVLRNAGFDRDEVLEALANGQCPAIDIRLRTPAAKRPVFHRVREYLEGRGCQREGELARNLHLSIPEVRRAVEVLLKDPRQAAYKPFDRPVIVHWVPTCRCATALVPDVPKGV